MPWARMVAFRELGTWAWLTATQITISLQICMQGWVTTSATLESLSSDGEAHYKKCTENHDAYIAHSVSPTADFKNQPKQ